VVGQHLNLYIIPNIFTVETIWKVWCDRGMSNSLDAKLYFQPRGSLDFGVSLILDSNGNPP